MARMRITLTFLTAAAVLVGVFSGWRVSIHFVRADMEGSGLEVSRLILQFPPGLLPDAAVAGGARTLVLGSGPAAAAANQPVRRPLAVAAGPAVTPGTPGHGTVTTLGPVSVAPLRRSPTGLHMTFPRTWHRLSYEIRAPQQKPAVPLVCVSCTAANRDQVITNTVEPAVAPLAGSSQITLLEWAP